MIAGVPEADCNTLDSEAGAVPIMPLDGTVSIVDGDDTWSRVSVSVVP